MAGQGAGRRLQRGGPIGALRSVSRRWPEPERDYREWHRHRAGNDFGLGATRLVRVAPLVVRTLCVRDIPVTVYDRD
ncbi:hypothetical protein [Micromonospora chersina]|uniref:hypothetical protein n=1 Tax=Micromonospora chersina TaxID=47854 RepID=UPI0036781BC5